MVPRNYESWFENGPWGLFTDPGDCGSAFHNYWTQVHHRERIAEPLMRWTDERPDMHELAHLVCARDHNVLDPTFGLRMGDPTVELGYTERLRELVVVYVEVLSLSWVESWTPNKNQVIRTTYLLAGGHLLSAQDRKLVMKWAMSRFPDIESVWKELQRKYALIEEIL
jgi:hypothetical protein